MLTLLALIFALHSGYSFLFAYEHQQVSAVLGGALSAAAAVGLWQKKSWVQYVIYTIAIFVFVYCVWYVWALLQLGWPYEDNVRSFVALVPGALILAFGVGASMHVYRVFRKKS